jgi:macrolide transport system ATP-binding/permease protein
MNIIELKNIYKTYSLEDLDVPVLKGISLNIAKGEYVALMGASGSGKSTLMNIIGCLDRPTSGEFYLDGQDVVAMSADERAVLRNSSIGFIFQNFNLLPRTSACDNVAMPLTYSPEKLAAPVISERAGGLLEKVGLGDRLKHEPSQLSGGQQQRVAIARALVNYPAIILADEPTGNLDSATSREILEVFRTLNENEGVTIILVTHDEATAKAADRVVRIKDGVILSGEISEIKDSNADVPFSVPDSEKKRPVKDSHPAVHFHYIIKTAVHSLKRNKLRAALTALGIVIGVAAVIAMMEIGRGSSTAIQKSIASMGANSILVLPGSASSGGAMHGAGSAMTLSHLDAEAIAAECPSVKAVAPVGRARAQLVYSNRNWVPSSIYGTTSSFIDVRDWPLSKGEMFSDRDLRNSNKVCVIGSTIARELFQEENPVGKELRVKNVPFLVKGVLASKGANMVGMDQDDIFLAPWTTVKFRVTGTSSTMSSASTSSTSSTSTSSSSAMSSIYPGSSENLYPEQSETQARNSPRPVRFMNVDHIFVAAKSARHVESAVAEIEGLLRERHRIKHGEENDFTLRNMTEMTKTLTATAKVMTRLLLAVAMISLLVGGVGIMNIMLVSVMERTREIGLRMAVGAQARNIMQQFLTESVFLCFLGGAAGIMLGRGISLIVRLALGWPTELSLDAVVTAFVVSAGIGIIFGYYPAWKAAGLDPIVALRYE